MSAKRQAPIKCALPLHGGRADQDDLVVVTMVDSIGRGHGRRARYSGTLFERGKTFGLRKHPRSMASHD
jgi:hypothetical protein